MVDSNDGVKVEGSYVGAMVRSMEGSLVGAMVGSNDGVIVEGS